MRWLIMALTLCWVATAAEAATIKAQLIRASNDRPPVDQRLKDLDLKLRAVFGYKYYQQLDYCKEVLKEKGSADLDVGRGFVVYVKSIATRDGVWELQVDWYSGNVAIAKQAIKLPAQQYVFIKGPDVGKESIVLALVLDP